MRKETVCMGRLAWSTNELLIMAFEAYALLRRILVPFGKSRVEMWFGLGSGYLS